MKNLRMSNPILKDINQYFGVLYDNNFQIRDVNIKFLESRDWEVTFESPSCLIKIYSDQFEIFIVFAPTNHQMDNRLGIASIIYYLSKGQKFIGKFNGNYRNRKEQLEWLATLLKEYITQITPFFEKGNFEKYHDELLVAQKEYYNLYVKKYVPGISCF